MGGVGEGTRGRLGIGAASGHMRAVGVVGPDHGAQGSTQGAHIGGVRTRLDWAGVPESGNGSAGEHGSRWVAARLLGTIPLDAIQALDSRDALAKELYGTLFDWLVVRINESIDNTATMSKAIGVLDIFGFEVFDFNSFEQLCINYANEKLHQQFVNHYFKVELDEYKHENVPVDFIDFRDNAPCLDLIEKKPVGILSLLHEECRLKTATDLSFVEKLNTSLKGRPHFTHAKLNPEQFIIQHFAGDVSYNAVGFLEKNKDLLHGDIQDQMLSASNTFVRGLFEMSLARRQSADAGGGGARGGTKSMVTVAGQFKEQVESLMLLLNATSPHYIRCIKPNVKKAPGLFEGKMVLEQLRYSGVLESIHIRRAGYSARFGYKAFVDRWKPLCKKIKSTDVKVQAAEICKAVGLQKEHFSGGKTKLFFKSAATVTLLDAHLEKLFSESATTIQARWKGRQWQQWFLEVKEANVFIQKHIRKYLIRKRFRRIVWAVQTLQPVIRGMQARRLFKRMKEAERLRKEEEERQRQEEERLRLEEEERQRQEEERLRLEEEERQRQEEERLAAEDAARTEEEKQEFQREQEAKRQQKEDEERQAREEEERRIEEEANAAKREEEAEARAAEEAARSLIPPPPPAAPPSDDFGSEDDNDSEPPTPIPPPVSIARRSTITKPPTHEISTAMTPKPGAKGPFDPSDDEEGAKNSTQGKRQSRMSKMKGSSPGSGRRSSRMPVRQSQMQGRRVSKRMSIIPSAEVRNYNEDGLSDPTEYTEELTEVEEDDERWEEESLQRGSSEEREHRRRGPRHGSRSPFDEDDEFDDEFDDEMDRRRGPRRGGRSPLDDDDDFDDERGDRRRGGDDYDEEYDSYDDGSFSDRDTQRQSSHKSATSMHRGGAHKAILAGAAREARRAANSRLSLMKKGRGERRTRARGRHTRDGGGRRREGTRETRGGKSSPHSSPRGARPSKGERGHTKGGRSTKKAAPEPEVLPPPSREAVVLRNGWLLKEDAGGGWKLRFCVLVPGRLLCYTSADCTEPKGSFLLAEDTQVSTEDARRPDPTYAFALSAKSHLRSLSLSAATQTNQHEWVDAMLAAKRPGLPFEAGSSVVVHMGWLHKQDKMGRGWKKRFFVLRGPWLSYYLDERCRERLGEMAIAASAMVTVMDATVSLPGSILASAITHTQVVVHQVLSLQSEGRELVLAAEEEIVLDKWAQVLDAAQDARQVQEPAKKVLATSRASGNTALREGWLMRLAEDGTWEETYAVLTAQQLLCYSGEDCVEGIGSRPTLRSTVHLLGWHGVPLRGQTGLINVFRFALSWSAQRAEDLAALEEEDAYAWEADIKHAAARIGAVMGVSAQPGSQLLGNRAIDDRGMGTGPYKEGWIVIGKCVGGLGKPPQPGAVPPLTFAEGRQAQVASWKQRYAVLCGKSLTLYTDHTYLDPRGELQLEGAGVQGMGQALEGLERQPSHMQLHPHLLKLTIVAPGRQQNSPSTAESLLMGLSTQREAQLWREQLLHGKTEAELPTSPGGYQLQIASSGAGSSPWRGAAGRSVLLEGWLEKERRGGAREWRMRYFVLRPGRLAYFTDHTCHVLKGELSLVEAIVAGPDERARYNEDMHLSRDTRRYFTVGTPTRVLGLAAEDSQSAAAWCDAIEAAAGTMQATSNADVALTPVTLAIEKQLAISQEEVRIYLPDGSFELVPVSETTMASD
ncbi:hypothetical protein CYMTET_47881, partial [Cymbomonas tetramitiformis]